MVLNYIWVAFFIIAFVIALLKMIFMGDMEVFPAMMNSTFDSSKPAFEISLGVTGVLSLWLGIMKIGEKGGVIAVLSRILSPVFTKLFPDIPKGHPCLLYTSFFLVSAVTAAQGISTITAFPVNLYGSDVRTELYFSTFLPLISMSSRAKIKVLVVFSLSPLWTTVTLSLIHI